MKEREANNGRLTIQQRLILNDKEQEDLTVLQSIQYLRQKGIMSEAAAASAAASSKKEDASSVKTKDEKKDNDPGPPLVVSSTASYKLLPAASASLPQPPPKAEPSPAQSQANGKSAENGNGEPTKPYQGWNLQGFGSNGKENSNVSP